MKKTRTDKDLVELRKKYKMSQKEMAEMVGVSKYTICRLEARVEKREPIEPPKYLNSRYDLKKLEELEKRTDNTFLNDIIEVYINDKNINKSIEEVKNIIKDIVTPDDTEVLKILFALMEWAYARKNDTNNVTLKHSQLRASIIMG